jgi:hypothetical protein
MSTASIETLVFLLVRDLYPTCDVLAAMSFAQEFVQGRLAEKIPPDLRTLVHDVTAAYIVWVAS